MNQSTRHFGAAVVLLLGVFFFGLAISGGAQSTPRPRGLPLSQGDNERILEQQLQSIPSAARAESNLRHLTSRPHMAGTEADHQVAEWLRDQYQSYGFDAQIVTYNAWLPLPREVKLELISPEQKTLGTREQPFEEDADSYNTKVAPGFNTYSPSGDVTAPIVYANYGMPDDYRELEAMGVSVEDKIVLARYGQGFRGIKAKVAEEHKAAGLIIYSDPQDDGYSVGDTFPKGPWRPMTGIQRGSILYTQIYPGDPLTPGVQSPSGKKHVAPDAAATLAHIPTMPINAQDAEAILSTLGGKHVPRGWQGSLPVTYHVGPGDTRVHLKIDMDYEPRPIYDVVAKLSGTNDNEWVILGNHHDAWVFGAADPGSGTSAMLEAARSLGELVRSGWKPRRSILMCEWDAEEPGLIGSTLWVEQNRAELQAKAVAYINTDVGVTGPNFSAAATPSLKSFIRDVTREVEDPNTKNSVYDSWRGRAVHAGQDVAASRRAWKNEATGEAPLGALGAGSDFSPFFDYAGIPSVDIGFGGDYGVYHSVYDDFYWMKHFGDPSFGYHAALARILGTIALRLDEADILPFDYSAYAAEITRMENDLLSRTSNQAGQAAALRPVAEASTEFATAASRATAALRDLGSFQAAPASLRELNHALVSVEQGFLAENGLAGRPWFKHTVYAPGSYAGYAAELMPGVNESLDRKDPATLRIEADSLAAALNRAAARLDTVTSLAREAAASSPNSGH